MTPDLNECSGHQRTLAVTSPISHTLDLSNDAGREAAVEAAPPPATPPAVPGKVVPWFEPPRPPPLPTLLPLSALENREERAPWLDPPRGSFPAAAASAFALPHASNASAEGGFVSHTAYFCSEESFSSRALAGDRPPLPPQPPPPPPTEDTREAEEARNTCPLLSPLPMSEAGGGGGAGRAEPPHKDFPPTPPLPPAFAPLLSKEVGGLGELTWRLPRVTKAAAATVDDDDDDDGSRVKILVMAGFSSQNACPKKLSRPIEQASSKVKTSTLSGYTPGRQTRSLASHTQSVVLVAADSAWVLLRAALTCLPVALSWAEIKRYGLYEEDKLKLELSALDAYPDTCATDTESGRALDSSFRHAAALPKWPRAQRVSRRAASHLTFANGGGGGGGFVDGGNPGRPKGLPLPLLPGRPKGLLPPPPSPCLLSEYAPSSSPVSALSPAPPGWAGLDEGDRRRATLRKLVNGSAQSSTLSALKGARRAVLRYD
mmetsp:Transcript_85143/g.165050  ORF Transcript_85143/g.165050 Transcript_85143/m.165050 type:complete len:488 (-) Transcript_85143:415-1878(-)